VDLKHTWIGDLVITLTPPPQTKVAAIVLHDRKGGSTRDLKKTYDAVAVPSLAAFKDKSCGGVWQLEIRDAAPRDDGTLVSFGLNLSFGSPAVRTAAAGRQAYISHE
jgi:subtilisin-like proprotein convertase family protein